MDPFLGQIMQTGFDYAPLGWMKCSGQELSVSQYNALFALLGTKFGGNGTTTFKLPDLQGRTMIGTGTFPVPPASPIVYNQGNTGGAVSRTIAAAQLPVHTHGATFTPTSTPLTATGALTATTAAATTPGPVLNGRLGTASDSSGSGATPVIYAPAGTSGTSVNLAGVSVSVSGGVSGGTVTVSATGGTDPLNLMQPYMAINTIIAVQGLWPQRD